MWLVWLLEAPQPHHRALGRNRCCLRRGCPGNPKLSGGRSRDRAEATELVYHRISLGYLSLWLLCFFLKKNHQTLQLFPWEDGPHGNRARLRCCVSQLRRPQPNNVARPLNRHLFLAVSEAVCPTPCVRPVYDVHAQTDMRSSHLNFTMT